MACGAAPANPQVAGAPGPIVLWQCGARVRPGSRPWRQRLKAPASIGAGARVAGGPEEDVVSPEESVPEAPELEPEELERRRRGLEDVIALMRPAVQMDGGDLQVVDVDYAAGVVEVQLQGACGSCAISATTLKGGVERLLHERLEWVREVRGGIDEDVDPFESAALGRGAYVPRYY